MEHRPDVSGTDRCGYSTSIQRASLQDSDVKCLLRVVDSLNGSDVLVICSLSQKSSLGDFAG
jgi:hypothetical protein